MYREYILLQIRKRQSDRGVVPHIDAKTLWTEYVNYEVLNENGN